MDKRIKQIVLENSNTIGQKWLEETSKNERTDYIKDIPKELFEDTNRKFVNVIFVNVEKKGGLTKELDDFSENLISLGWPLSYLTKGLQTFRRITIDFILGQSDQSDRENIEYFSTLVHLVDTWIDPIINQLVNQYSGNWEQTLSLQQVALQELSAPLIPVMEDITIMPLVGTIDTGRAKLIMENLLDGVIKHNSKVVLIDITGVPVVDTMVAHHIIQAAEAVRLIGATCILVGIRPEIAQTIVNLGIDLGNFTTKSSLKKGFQTALGLTNRQVVNIKNGENIEELIDSLNRE